MFCVTSKIYGCYSAKNNVFVYRSRVNVYSQVILTDNLINCTNERQKQMGVSILCNDKMNKSHT